MGRSKGAKVWTKTELDKLKLLHVKKLSPKDIAEVLGRSKSTVLSKMSQIGLSQNSELPAEQDPNDLVYVRWMQKRGYVVYPNETGYMVDGKQLTRRQMIDKYKSSKINLEILEKGK